MISLVPSPTLISASPFFLALGYRAALLSHPNIAKYTYSSLFPYFFTGVI